MNYKMDELLPIVAELAEKYTSKESTSVSYETARRLMEAVLYCIHHCESENQLVSKNGLSTKEAYQSGYKKVIEKVKKTQIAYNQMLTNFCAYGNENYHDTVTKAIPGFFRYYDVRFAPQETIITMDYPVICPITDCCGIDAMAKYVEYISYEQRFMGALPQEYVQEVLYQFQPNYRKQIYNICSIILRHILGYLLMEKKPILSGEEENYIVLCNTINQKSEEELRKQLKEILQNLVKKAYFKDEKMYKYLEVDLYDFTKHLQNGAKHNCLRRVLVL